MPFIDFYMPDESYEDFLQMREQAIRDGRPIVTFTLPDEDGEANRLEAASPST